MSDVALDAIKVIAPALIGLLGGYLIKRSEVNYHARKAAADTWEAQKQTHWSPLLKDSQELRRRFEFLSDVYLGKRHEFDPGSLSGDFRELYMLKRDLIESLEKCDPNPAAKRQ